MKLCFVCKARVLPWLCKCDQDLLNTQWGMLVPRCLIAVSNGLGVIQCNHWHLESMTISFLFSFLFLITFALFFLRLLHQIGCSHRVYGCALPESSVLVQFLQVKRKMFNHFPFSLVEKCSLFWAERFVVLSGNIQTEFTRLASGSFFSSWTSCAFVNLTENISNQPLSTEIPELSRSRSSWLWESSYWSGKAE